MVFVVILASGASTRFGSDKSSHTLYDADTGDISVLERTLSVFQEHEKVDSLCLIGSKKMFPSPQKKDDFIAQFPKISPLTGYIFGGDTRYKSFLAGIRSIKGLKNSDHNTKILVHNAANPFVTPQEITSVLDYIAPGTAAAVSRKITNTIRFWDKESMSSHALSRDALYAMETPQGAFLEDFESWIAEHEKVLLAEDSAPEITDELMLAETYGGKVSLLPASPENIKITVPEDIPEKYRTLSRKIPVMGYGVDSHRWGTDGDEHSGNCAVLCGVTLGDVPKFSGNSDADIALHALCNALLSGIGQNSFSAFADELCHAGEKNSAVYLEHALQEVSAADKKVIHVVLSFEGKRPKLESRFPLFRESLSRLLSLPSCAIGLNATTGEGLDGVGKGEGLKVTAVVTLL